jgi:indolepyruvate ferredoxin oxidoreductase
VALWLRGHEEEQIPDTLGDLLADRMPRLHAWGGARHARRYRALVARVEETEARFGGCEGRLSRAVAHVAAKLMTYKDEYEVARLMTEPSFAARLAETFEGEFEIHYNLAPPLISPRDERTGRPRKRRFGPRMAIGFRALRRLRVLRGTKLDIFGYGVHRRMERTLIGEYTALVEQVLAGLKSDNVAEAEAILRAHGKVRGYDVVKEQSVARVREDLPGLLAALKT